MRMPPLLADFSHARACKPFCEKYLTLPAQRFKQFSQRGELTAEVMRAIMSEEKKETERVTLKGDTLRKYFPASYTPKRMEETIIRLLEQWQKKRRTRDCSR